MLAYRPSSCEFRGKDYLSDNDLLSSKEGAVPVIEIHLLCVALRVLGNPQFLRVTLQSDVDETQGKYQGDGESSDKYEEPVMVVEPSNFLENELKVHVMVWLKVELKMIMTKNKINLSIIILLITQSPKLQINRFYIFVV